MPLCLGNTFTAKILCKDHHQPKKCKQSHNWSPMKDKQCSVNNCHKKQRNIYPSAGMIKTLASLELSVTSGSLKQQGRDLGTLAVQACATCHGTHRLAFGAKEKFNQKISFAELIKH